LPTVWRSGGKDKSLHEWAQGDGGVWIPIDCLTDLGELILDPFAGSGTWGRIATAMGRRWTGADLAPGGTETVMVEPLPASLIALPDNDRCQTRP
jgi:hypothetical protein